MAKIIQQSQYITKNELEVLSKCSVNVFEFARQAFIRHPIRGKVKFDLYPYQKKVLWYFLTKRFNIVLKFRQAGLTELIALYVLWLALFHDNKNIVIISIKDRVAKRVLDRIKYIYKNLPHILQTPIINGRSGEYGTAKEMEFSNGSLITSIPTTEDAGRSEAVSLLVIDEAAIVRWANQIWAAAFPTLSTGGASIINSCVTGDTRIIGKDRTFRIDEVCPPRFGRKNISNLDLRVLTHTGKWRRVLGAVNKGLLETWEVSDSLGNSLKCTPNHKLLTPGGWVAVKEIIENNINVITYDPKIIDLLDNPITVPPKEEIREILNYPNYRISNLGKVYCWKDGVLVEKLSRLTGRTTSGGKNYYSITLWKNCQKKKVSIHKLVAETFIAPIKAGYTVDHINGNPEDNYVTNLEIVSIRENTRRASQYSRGMTLGNKIGKGFPNLQLIGKIREKAFTKTPDEIIQECHYELGVKITRPFISRILNGKRTTTVQISKLTLIRKYIDTIYDISVEGDGSYITESTFVNHNTPYGVGNWFHSTWVDAIAGGNGFNPIRLKWKMHPERDEDWYKAMRAVLGPKRTAQEIDGDFLASGDSVFDLADIRDIEEQLDSWEVKKELNGNLLTFKPPKLNTRFFIGADVASGRSRDYSAFSIMDRYGEEYAAFKGKIPPDRFADLLMKKGREYNNAVLAPEGNDIGLSTVHRIQNEGYSNLYYTIQLLKEKGESKPKEEKIPGWLTTSKNRLPIIDELETDIRHGEVTIKDPFFTMEAYTFIYDERNRPVAMGKAQRNRKSGDDGLEDSEYTDDSIMAKAITNFVRKGKYNSVIVAPQ